MNDMIANRYALVQLIGQGGMASVYLAVDTILKREVAVKILRGDLSKDSVSLTRFQREANAATKLSHPNIVEVYDVGEDNGRYFIVMEYVKGRSLKELINQRGALPKEEAVNIMKQLVSAVSTAHKNGIIHRDIKSQNVLIKDDGTVKLSDFGIALAADAVQLTQTDVVIGSVHYLAPELARGESATQQSDIYALGIVFYEMLTGDVPHHGDAPVQIALKHLREEIPSVRDFNSEIPQSVDNIIRKATVKNKEYRYPSASAMYDDLVTCLDLSRKNEPIVQFANDSDTVTQELQVEETSTKSKKNRNLKLSNVAIIISIVVVAAALTVSLLFLTGVLSIGKKSVTVPDVTNLSKDQAISVLEDAGLTVDENLNYELTQDITKGNVSKTVPSANTTVEKGTSIILYICEDNYYYMQDFTGWNYKDVETTLNEKCKVRIIYNYVDDVNADVGKVVQQSIAVGEEINPTRLIEMTFTITRNPSFQIPSAIIGMDYNTAKETLEKLGATVELVGTKRTQTCTNKVDDPTTEDVDESKEQTCVFDQADSMVGKVYSSDPTIGTLYTQTKTSTVKVYYYSE